MAIEVRVSKETKVILTLIFLGLLPKTVFPAPRAPIRIGSAGGVNANLTPIGDASQSPITPIIDMGVEISIPRFEGGLTGNNIAPSPSGLRPAAIAGPGVNFEGHRTERMPGVNHVVHSPTGTGLVHSPQLPGAEGQLKHLVHFDRPGSDAAAFDGQKFSGELLIAEGIDAIGTTPKSHRALTNPLGNPQFQMAAQKQGEAIRNWSSAPMKGYLFLHSYEGPDDGVPGLKYYSSRGAITQMQFARDPNSFVIIVLDSPIPDQIINEFSTEDMRKRIHFVVLNDHSDPHNLSTADELLKQADKIAEIRKIKLAAEKNGFQFAYQPYNSNANVFAVARKVGIDAILTHLPELDYFGGKAGNHKVHEEVLASYGDGSPALEEFMRVHGDRYTSVAVKGILGRGNRKTYEQVVETINMIAGVYRNAGKKLNRIVLKNNVGSGGEGMIFPYIPENWLDLSASERMDRVVTIFHEAPSGPKVNGKALTFYELMQQDGLVVQEFIAELGKPGATVTYPSGQFEVRPDHSRAIVTHEQRMLGPNYVGSDSYAKELYRPIIEEITGRVAAVGQEKNIWWFGSEDYVVIDYPNDPNDPQGKRSLVIYPMEQNWRITATWHIYEMAKRLTNAHHQYPGGPLVADSGRKVYWFSVDHDVRPNLVGLTMEEYNGFFNRPKYSKLKYNGERQSGFVPVMISGWGGEGNVAYGGITTHGRANLASLERRLTSALNELEFEHVYGIRAGDPNYFYSHIDDGRKTLLSELLSHRMTGDKFRDLFNQVSREFATLLSPQPGTEQRAYILFHGNNAGYTIAIRKSGDSAEDRRAFANAKGVAKSVMAHFEQRARRASGH